MKTVLLVEDNFDNREIYATVLEVSGYRVVQAVNGREGVERARAERPDLVLMDISLPVMDGFAAFRELRADPTFAKIPVVALTAHALTADRDAILEAGFDGYIAKPAEPKAVLAEVRERIGPPDGG